MAEPTAGTVPIMAAARSDPGYLRFPAIQGDTVVFVCEDDLWLTTVATMLLSDRRSTAGALSVLRPGDVVGVAPALGRLLQTRLKAHAELAKAGSTRVRSKRARGASW